MNSIKHKTKFSEKQLEILKLLMSKNYRQNELQKVLGITSPALIYHLNKLDERKLIVKKTIQQIGNARINEISINPIQMQQIRMTLGLKITGCTLITGFGELLKGYAIPDQAFNLLQSNYKINRIVCFSTPNAQQIRKENENKENLIKIHQFYLYDYLEYRNLHSKFFSELDDIISNEVKEANLIIDITPLSKLYSFIMLKKANEYSFPCFYLEQDEKEIYYLLWMSNIKIEGEMK